MIYVDPLRPCPPVDPTGGRWRFKNYCHIWSADLSELHRFAQEKLSLKLEYFQDLPGFPHYDLTKTMRLRAVRAGALEIGAREMVERADALHGSPDSWIKRSRQARNY